MNFADNLKKIRKENNLSQEQLAEKLGISRQAVSKWESGSSYPEMDKVIQICNIFNVNMDDLLNNDINKVKDKESNNANKYIKSFFDYITKVVDMFSSMKLKQILLCLIEQFIIIGILFTVLGIIGSIGYSIFGSIFGFLPVKVYSIFYNIIEAIFILCSTVIGIVVYLHIFKIRYLDYYEIVKVNDEINNEDSIEEIEDKNDKVILEQKREKVIIRDPKHSEFSFINGMAKMILYFIKFIAMFFLLGLGAVLCSFVICLILCFVIVKTGILFIGAFSFSLGCVLFTYVVFELIFNFIFSRNFSKMRILIFSVVSIFLTGVGIGLVTISIKDFDYVEYSELDRELILETFSYDMNKDLIINNNFYLGNIEYVEKDIDNVEIVLEYSKFLIGNVYYNEDSKSLDIHTYENNKETFNMIKKLIDEFNNKRIVTFNDSNNKIIVYASKENLEIIKKNNNEYNNYMNELNENLDVYENNYRELENYVSNMENIRIVYDKNGYIVGIYSDVVED